MSLTKVEAAKLTNDLLLRGVIETIISDSSVLQLLPFEQCVRDPVHGAGGTGPVDEGSAGRSRHGRCGGRWLLGATERRGGPNAGRKYYGCMDSPKCGGVVKID
jgi:hypothetical protein